MKKNKGMAYTALGIAFALFNVIAFAVPSAKFVTFWIVYVFTAIAFVSQAAIWKSAFKKTNTLKSKFLGIPIIFVGITYLIVQAIAFAIFMAFPLAPNWIAILVCSLILSISAISLIGTETGREEINRVETKVEKKVFYIKSLLVDVELLAEKETDTDIKVALIKLAEKIRFSDPMSDETLVNIEFKITNKVKELKIVEDKLPIITMIDSLLTERNKRVKLLK